MAWSSSGTLLRSPVLQAQFLESRLVVDEALNDRAIGTQNTSSRRRLQALNIAEVSMPGGISEAR